MEESDGPELTSICLGCMAIAVGKLQNGGVNHRPNNTNMQTAIKADSLRPRCL
jgi:hypothetical protein